MEKSKEDFYKIVLDEITALKAAKDELKEVLEFYEDILKAQREAKLAFRVDLRDFDVKSGHHRNSQGLPFLKPDDIQLDQDLFGGLLENIGKIIQSKTEKAISTPLKKIYLEGEWETLLCGLMEDESSLQKIAVENNIDFVLLSFLVVQSLSPFLDSFAEKLRGNINPSWLRGYCPVCGAQPLMARLESETGRKRLFCGLCHSEWWFRRLECPFCENDNQESLRYFYLEDEEAYRVDVCYKCKRYTKTVDARKTESVRSLFAEDLATLPLDIIAEKEGFVSRAPYFPFWKRRSLRDGSYNPIRGKQ
ncbi:MAG: formate dehydrogenase accessory protein FdhE [bacterium]